MALISISGKIGSGKDTAASIIQKLTPYYNWENKKWAGKLKQIASILTGIPVENFEDQEFKKTFLNDEWSKIKAKPGRRQDGIFPNHANMELVPMSVRELLQKLGTEAMRDGLHENVWVNALFSDYIPYSSRGSEYEFEESNWIITDTRFPNELSAIKRRGGISIKIVRNSGNTVGNEHSSETALDHVTDWDYVIDNNGTPEELRQKIYDILDNENLIKFTGL
jgi:hypothetical protein